MTKADRLFAIVKAVNAVAAIFHEESKTSDPNGGGQWPGGRAPYLITPHERGQRVAVVSSDGDVISGVGSTVDEAITHLEQKVELAPAPQPAGE